MTNMNPISFLIFADYIMTTIQDNVLGENGILTFFNNFYFENFIHEYYIFA